MPYQPLPLPGLLVAREDGHQLIGYFKVRPELDRTRQPRCRRWPEMQRAGGDGFKWGGVRRGIFVTADWAEVDPADGGAVAAGISEGELNTYGTTAAQLRSNLPRGVFAGVVCARAD